MATKNTTAATGLGRGARGLPRFWLDVRWWRTERFHGLDPAALFVWQACVSACNESTTDGALPADLDDLSMFLGVRRSWLDDTIPALLDAGVLARRHGGRHDRLVIPGFTDHNPSKADVDGLRKERSKAGRKGNHTRHHVNQGVVDPECEFCRDDLSARNGGRKSDRTCDDPSATKSEASCEQVASKSDDKTRGMSEPKISHHDAVTSGNVATGSQVRSPDRRSGDRMGWDGIGKPPPTPPATHR